MTVFLLEAQLLSPTPRAPEVGRGKGTNGFKLKIKDGLHPLLVGMDNAAATVGKLGGSTKS